MSVKLIVPLGRLNVSHSSDVHWNMTNTILRTDAVRVEGKGGSYTNG